MRLGAAHHALAPPILDDRLRGFGPRPVVAIERTRRKVAIKLRAIGGELRLKSVKNFFGQAARIGRRLHHQRRHRADDGRLRHPALAVPSQVVHHLAAAGGMADVNGVLQIEMRRQSRKVVGIVIHVMAAARLGGSAVAAAVMGYDSIAMIEEEQHLRVPVIGRQRPTMAEHDGLTFAPVLVEDLNTVFGCNRAHVTSSLAWLSSPRGYPNLRTVDEDCPVLRCATMTVIPSELKRLTWSNPRQLLCSCMAPGPMDQAGIRLSLCCWPRTCGS